MTRAFRVMVTGYQAPQPAKLPGAMSPRVVLSLTLALSALLWPTSPVAAQEELADDFPDLPGRVIDPRDGEMYSTVEIGGREWLAENLRYRPEDSDEVWCYGGRPDECARHGALYSHAVALDACPPDWRLPRKADWDGLIEALGGSELAARALAPDGTAGFDLAPTGVRTDGRFSALESEGFWWARDADADGQAWGLHLRTSGVDDVRLEPAARAVEGSGAAVRCLR